MEQLEADVIKAAEEKLREQEELRQQQIQEEKEAQLRQIRQRIRLCDHIAEDTPRIKAQLQQCEQAEKEAQAKSKSKQRKPKGGYDLWQM